MDLYLICGKYARTVPNIGTRTALSVTSDKLLGHEVFEPSWELVQGDDFALYEEATYDLLFNASTKKEKALSNEVKEETNFVNFLEHRPPPGAWSLTSLECWKVARSNDWSRRPDGASLGRVYGSVRGPGTKEGKKDIMITIKRAPIKLNEEATYDLLFNASTKKKKALSNEVKEETNFVNFLVHVVQAMIIMVDNSRRLLLLRMEKKRKIDSECRKFKDQWNNQYFVIESSNKALCLICNESIAVLKEYNMKRHYETKHSQNYSKYTGIVRTEKFEALKRGLKSQQSLFTKVKTEQEAATRASFRVALEIPKRGKPFTDGEMIKECIIAVVEEMCPEKVNLLKTVSMSANTVARRVENIAENISSQLFDKNGHVEWFSLALDESTDVSDTAQVLIYIRGVDKSYEVHEELLDMYSIHGTTTGTDIFKGVEMAINKKNLRWKNLKCITTDGGKNMSGKDKGVVALVSKAVENDGGSKPLVLHCIIHQQSLCGKCLDMSDVLKPVISTVNFIRSFGLNHRQFRQFIAEIGETDLPYHTAVRWLSCGKVLQRFFELRAVIEIFLNEKHRPLTELQNNAWLWKLAFYVDLTKHVNELNLRLQGENQHLPDLYTNIKSFRMKLILFQLQLRSMCCSLLTMYKMIFQGLITTLQLVEKLDRYPLRNKRQIDSVESDETSMNVKTEAGTQVSNYVVQHLPRNPSIFSGEDGEDLQKWLKGYARVAKYNHWDETLCLTKVYFYLSGTALKWFENNNESIQTWKEFTSQLENVFGKKENSKLQAEKKLKTRAQLKGESTEFYIQDVLCLCKEANLQMSEEDKISHLMKGIAEELYQALLPRDVQSTEQFITECRRVEALRCRRVTPTKYERLPNVASLCDQDYGEDLSSLIRKIVREEIKQVLDSPHEEPKIAVIEDLVREEIVKTLAPRSKPTISPPQATRPEPNTRYEAQTIRPHPEPHYRKQGRRCDTNEWRTTEGKPICFYCGRPGHVVRYCRDRKRHNEERRNEYFRRKKDAKEFYNSQTKSQEPNDESSRKNFSRYRSPTPYTGRNRQNFSPARRSSWSPRHEN
ncbi:EPM2AIP1 [Cordylochernes scorpioides]|uniref:EPM2AIP1 n=1 Tax=Cordylochernes scorpioides TaxID=51811 RepID=A0ABY6K1G7_9ARAC|nr:EPM2AIP1 [Cordylochernes scorpioides]